MSTKTKPSKRSSLASNLSGLGGLLMIFGPFLGYLLLETSGTVLAILIALACGISGLCLGIKAKRQMTDEEKQTSCWRDGTKTRAWTAIVIGIAVIIGGSFQLIKSIQSSDNSYSYEVEQEREF